MGTLRIVRNSLFGGLSLFLWNLAVSAWWIR